MSGNALSILLDIVLSLPKLMTGWLIVFLELPFVNLLSHAHLGESDKKVLGSTVLMAGDSASDPLAVPEAGGPEYLRKLLYTGQEVPLVV